MKRPRSDEDALVSHFHNLTMIDLIDDEKHHKCVQATIAAGKYLMPLTRIVMKKDYDSRRYHEGILLSYYNVISQLDKDEAKQFPERVEILNSKRYLELCKAMKDMQTGALIVNFCDKIVDAALLMQSDRVIPDDFHRCTMLKEIQSIFHLLKGTGLDGSIAEVQNGQLYEALNKCEQKAAIYKYLDKMIAGGMYVPMRQKF